MVCFCTQVGAGYPMLHDMTREKFTRDVFLSEDDNEDTKFHKQILPPHIPHPIMYDTGIYTHTHTRSSSHCLHVYSFYYVCAYTQVI